MRRGGNLIVLEDAWSVPPSEPSSVQEAAASGKRIRADVVGPVCESGDFLALDRPLPGVTAGEYLAVLGTGAYGFVMSSTYNARPRPPEVLIEGERYYIARPREQLDDLFRSEVLDPTTWYQT